LDQNAKNNIKSKGIHFNSEAEIYLVYLHPIGQKEIFGGSQKKNKSIIESPPTLLMTKHISNWFLIYKFPLDVTENM
jgi:hypothetical protein